METVGKAFSMQKPKLLRLLSCFEPHGQGHGIQAAHTLDKDFKLSTCEAACTTCDLLTWALTVVFETRNPSPRPEPQTLNHRP